MKTFNFSLFLELEKSFLQVQIQALPSQSKKEVTSYNPLSLIIMEIWHFQFNPKFCEVFCLHFEVIYQFCDYIYTVRG